jgi:hypothetical protein
MHGRDRSELPLVSRAERRIRRDGPDQRSQRGVETLQVVRRKIAGSAEARRKVGHAARAVLGARATLRC